ncbi:MAG: hypothetical protein GY906_32915 [bacterium]|nr:hypothetical protein [bacterium]
MCHQTVGLVQAEIERRGIVTTGITAIPEVTAKVGLPRALEVPYPLGFQLGTPHNSKLQRSIILAALSLTSRSDVPLIEAFKEEQG